MPIRVSRGLLATESVSAYTPTKLTPEDIAQKRIDLLQTEPLKGFHWRETYEWAARLRRGVGDERGRRLYTDAGFMDAKYVQEVAHRAALGRDLPSTPVQWSYLRNSIARIHEELRGRAPKAPVRVE